MMENGKQSRIGKGVTVRGGIVLLPAINPTGIPWAVLFGTALIHNHSSTDPGSLESSKKDVTDPKAGRSAV
jgi:hypothetical protein